MELNLNINKKVFLPIYYPYLFDYSNRYNVFYGGRSSGKTFFITQKLLLKGLKERRNILLMQKQTNKVKDSVWKELLLAIDAFGLTDYFLFNKSEFRAICKLNKTEFRCIGLDEPEKIKGYANISDVYLDEVTAFTQEDIELIDGTLRSPKYKLPLQMYFSFNPVSKANWVYKYWGFDGSFKPKDTFILKTTYLDNPRINQGFITYLDNLRVRNYKRWQIEALGDFVSLDKLVFEEIEVREFDHKEINGQLCIGMDFGFTNDLSTIVASVATDRELYIFQAWGSTGKTNKELAQVIKDFGFSKSQIIADSAEPKSIVELRREGIERIKPSVKGPDSINHGIDRMKQYKIIVHPSCTGLIEEFENYAWQKDKNSGEYINKPIDKFNHYIDACRYSLQCMDQARINTFDKRSLGL